jgi:hypothetical protein
MLALVAAAAAARPDAPAAALAALDADFARPDAPSSALAALDADLARLDHLILERRMDVSTLAGAETPRGRHFAGFVFDSEAAAQGLLAEHVMEFVRSAPVLQVLHAGADEEPTVVDVGG